jgi:SAM-dependent methyltransferase
MRWRALYLIRALFRIAGRSWNDFYAWMLDFQDRHVTLDQILRRGTSTKKHRGLWDWQRGQYFLTYMSRHGLQPTHRVLDYGCGYGRGTIPLLRHQEVGGHYIGTEISKRRLALAQEWIRREGLSGKSYELVLSKDNTMRFLPDKSVDVIWVLSVFNHMPDRELDLALKAMARILASRGRLFCYYLTEIEGGDTSVKTFRRPDADMAQRLGALGFEFRWMDDWDDDIGAGRPPDSRMIIAVKSESKGQI